MKLSGWWIPILFASALYALADVSTVAAEEAVYSPADGATVETDQPTVSVAFPKPIDVSSVFVMIDDLDVTAAATITGISVSYEAVLPLAPGNHDVIVQGGFPDGTEFTHWWSFVSTETKKSGPDRTEFRTEMNGNAFWLVNDNDLDGTLPEHGVEVFGPSHFRIAEGQASFEVRGSFHYLDQDGPVVAAGAEEGADFRDFLIVSRYAGDSLTTELGAGDISLQETSLTAPGLQRRGVYLQQGGKGVTARIFSVNATPVFGVRDGPEIEVSRQEGIAGASVEFATADNLSRIHLTLLSGSDRTGTGFAQSDAGIRNEGQAIGASWYWNLASGKARGWLELAAADFKADADAAISRSEDDIAFKAGLVWAPAEHYEAAFNVEELGTDFVSIGNPGAVNDIRRMTLRNGFYNDKNRFDLVVGYAVDNLDNRPTLATTSLWQIRGVNTYRYSDHFNLALELSREMIESDDEPVNFSPTDIVTDRIELSAALVYGKWTISPLFAFSERDDRTVFDADTDLNEWRANFSWQPSTHMTLSLLLPQVIIEDDHITGVERKSELISILLNSTALDGLLQFDLSGNWQYVEASDNSIDETSSNYVARAAVSLKDYLPEYFQPSLYLKGLHSRIENDLLAVTQDEFTLYLGIEVFSGWGL